MGRPHPRVGIAIAARLDVAGAMDSSLTSVRETGMDCTRNDRCPRRQAPTRPLAGRAAQSTPDLLVDLPTPEPGTHIYIATDGLRHETVMLLRAFVRTAERGGSKVKLL